MDGSMVPLDRGPNLGVTFDNSEFTHRLFETVGSGARYIGPGPAEHSWTSATSARHERFAISLLARELYSKYDDGISSKEKSEGATRKFRDSEALCALTNQKFCPNVAGQFPIYLDADLDDGQYPFEKAVLLRARKLLFKLYGPFPGWQRILPLCDFGPGATTRLPRKKAARSNKWAGRPHVTPFPSSAVAALFSELPLLQGRLARPGYQMVPGNTLELVPKSYKIDRTIAIEPDWNMFLQKGIGSYIRGRLKRVGQDLTDQSVNQFLAALGSIDGSLSTIDLSMASDTLAYRLLEFLLWLRPDWFVELEQLRSPVGLTRRLTGDPNEWVIYEKFSSMGNGYTFEVESSVFWAIIRAVSELKGGEDRRCFVYGDDLICPTDLAPDVIRVLRFCGFMVNEDKSFTSGPFRESCGKHYFEGEDVSPFYVREKVDSIDRLFLLHNNVCRWFTQFPYISDPIRVRELLEWIRSHAPEEWREPRLNRLDIGDGAFYGATCPTPIAAKRKKGKLLYPGWEGYFAKVLNYTDKRDRIPAKGTKHHQKWLDANRFSRERGPDLASLWKIEQRYAVPQGNHVSETPYEHRWWSVGHQVMPWVGDFSWYLF